MSATQERQHYTVTLAVLALRGALVTADAERRRDQPDARGHALARELDHGLEQRVGAQIAATIITSHLEPGTLYPACLIPSRQARLAESAVAA